MSRFPEVSPEVRKAVELAVLPRIRVPRDKELMARFKISRATLHRIMREVRNRVMRQLSQTGNSEAP